MMVAMPMPPPMHSVISAVDLFVRSSSSSAVPSRIASRAERHFRVEKVPGDPTHTRIELLNESERRDELERMLGGREFLAVLADGKEL